MRRLASRWIVLLTTVLLLGAIVVPQPLTRAQEPAATPPSTGAEPIRETLFQAILRELPPPPALIRVLRLTLQPGASVPLHTHPGPEFGQVEAGVLTVRVEGEAVIAQDAAADTTQAARVPPIGQEFDLRPGDQIVYPAGVPMSFSNRGQDPVSVLSVVILPLGDDAPPSSEWVGGTPGPDASAGVRSDLLGDAIAPGWPEPPLAIVLERLVLGPGDAIPGRAGPVLLSVEIGTFAFALVEGQFQLWRSGIFPVAAATPDTSYLLSPGDAIFFPAGMNDVPRTEADGVLVLLRFSVVSAAGLIPPDTSEEPAAGQATAADPPAGAPAATQAAAGAAAPTPAATAPTPTAAAPAADAVVNEDGVRLRGTPSTTGEVVAELNAGREVIIIGEAVEGEGIFWVPIQALDDPAATGFIAEDFLDPVP